MKLSTFRKILRVQGIISYIVCKQLDTFNIDTSLNLQAVNIFAIIDFNFINSRVNSRISRDLNLTATTKIFYDN